MGGSLLTTDTKTVPWPRAAGAIRVPFSEPIATLLTNESPAARVERLMAHAVAFGSLDLDANPPKWPGWFRNMFPDRRQRGAARTYARMGRRILASLLRNEDDDDRRAWATSLAGLSRDVDLGELERLFDAHPDEDSLATALLERRKLSSDARAENDELELRWRVLRSAISGSASPETARLRLYRRLVELDDERRAVWSALRALNTKPGPDDEVIDVADDILDG